jgi:hypothetical protein
MCSNSLRGSRIFLLLVAAVLALAPAGALAAEPSLESHPGYVDASFLAQYADESGEFVEVTLDEPLLKLFSGPAASYDEDVGRLAGNMKSVRALVITLRDGTQDEVFDRMAEIRADLEGRGWQKIAEVREQSERVNVLMKTTEEAILGITVLVLDGKQLVFANIAGEMTMEDLERLAAKHAVPGLEQLKKGEGHEHEEDAN